MNRSELYEFCDWVVLKLPNTERKNFKILLEHFAFYLNIDRQIPLYSTEELGNEFSAFITDFKQSDEWKSEYLYDPLSDYGVKRGIFKERDIISKENASEYAQSLDLPERKKPYLIMDEHCSSGRKLLACHRRFGNNALYAGKEGNQFLYRICVINMHMYHIHAHILHTSHGYVEPDSYPTDWGWANQFVIPKIAVLQQRETRLERREWSEY